MIENAKQKVLTRLEKMSESMRLVSFILAAFLTVIFWYFLFDRPFALARKHKLVAVDAILKQLQPLQAQESAVLRRLDETSGSRSRAKNLIQKATQLGTGAPPLAILRDRLTHAMSGQTGIRFMGLKISPPAPWLSGSTQGILLSAALQQAFQVRVEMRFNAGYVDTIDYLARLAAMPWHLQWHSLNYQVAEWPEAEVTVVFSLLGNEGNAS